MLSTQIIATAQNTAKPELTGVAHVALRVSDVDAEVQFLGKLGFEQAFAHEQNGRRAFVFVKINDREFIEVHPHTPLNATAPQPLGFNHICYETTNANAQYANWVANGLNPTQVAKGPDGTLEFAVTDPAGGVTEALEFVPDSQPAKDRGQHLGAKRVSDWLMGIEMPVSDMQAWVKFYEKLGFSGSSQEKTVRLSSPANRDLQIVLRPAGANEKTNLLFAVKNAKNTAEQLRGAGLAVETVKNQVIVHDPDGNTMVLMQKSASQAQK
jgi:catechol 2,3-dioxygenase-like lactoylglutathione lyase family enzyme